MGRINFRDQIARNKRNSFFLMLMVILVIVVLGYVISFAFEPGYFFVIMILASLFSIFYVMISFYNSDKIALASVKAHEARREDYKEYHNLVEGLCIASGMPKPRLYTMDSEQINAFASGRDPQNAVICVTKGALKKLEKRELEGVLAHELGHISNYDIRYMTLVAVMVGMVSIISQIFLRSLWFRGGGNDKSKAFFIVIGVVLAILAPIVVYFVQMSISRKREFTSDASAVMFTRNPRGLIGALKRIQTENPTPEKKVSKTVAPLFFSNPFKGIGRTHPPLEKRIDKLERM